MYSKKDDNENKGRRSGKGPKLSKGMKKAARQEKKTARKTARKTKKVIKKLAKAVSKDFKKNIPAGMSKEGVTRFVGSQPVITKVPKPISRPAAPRIQKSLRKGITPPKEVRFEPMPVKKNMNYGNAMQAVTNMAKSSAVKKKELTRGQKRSYELRDAHS